MAKGELEDPSTTLAGDGLRSRQGRVCSSSRVQRENLENSRQCGYFTSLSPASCLTLCQESRSRVAARGQAVGATCTYDSQPGTGRALGRVHTDSARMCFTFSDVPLRNFSICTEKMGLITHRGSDLSYSHRFLKLLYVFL